MKDDLIQICHQSKILGEYIDEDKCKANDMINKDLIKSSHSVKFDLNLLITKVSVNVSYISMAKN